ncbi:hypothetical protein B0H11DRAFT_1751339 [Mycena galericulata]|nr:hypothetical protein B0H11DRAFT_1754844 [Mycena galericulata]KAJ7439888.1 hypothetical protein B0H11DRAFT_1751339 [Mycena galericulata]
MTHVAIKRLAAADNGINKFSSCRSSHPHLRTAELFAALSRRSFRIAASQADALFDANSHLLRPFPGPWTSATFEFGQETVSTPTWCDKICWWWLAITALGNYDPDRGGQLILWDLGRVLRFPPGTTILFPPILRYSVAKIQDGETRYSITRYAAGPHAGARWPAAAHLFSKLDEF